jgi:lipid-A-disaccharide synthase
MVAGERSGDLHGAELTAALQRELGEVSIFGCGGAAMRSAGVETAADLRDFAMVGITEVISGLPRARRAFHAILAESDRRRPQLAVLIDAPSLNLRLAKQLKPRKIPVAYYVSPQIWAWKKWRLRHLQDRVDHMLCLFDFEEEIYRRAGIKVTYVGHPLVDRPEMTEPALPRHVFLARAGLEAGIPMVALLPGSREIELKYNLPPLVQAAAELRRRGQNVQFVLPVAATLTEPQVEAQLEACGATPGLIHTVTYATHDALRFANAAVVASGTATLETALLGCPMVVVYRVAPSTAFFARFMVDVPFFSMVNLLAGKEVVKELVQRDFTGERVADEVERLLNDPETRDKMIVAFDAVRARLGPGGAVRRAATTLAEMVRTHRRLVSTVALAGD